MSVEQVTDPEDSTHQYLVFDVVARGQYADYRERETEWYDAVERMLPGVLDEVRLVVLPQS